MSRSNWKHSWLWVAVALITLAAGRALAQDARKTGGERPNVVWIICEDLGPALGSYGHGSAITPNLDRLAASGILYRNAFATAPICSPARSCLITGVYPTSLGSQHLRCEITLPPSIAPFPRYLKDAGYFVTSTFKTDFNFSAAGLFDYHGSDEAPWRKRKGREPFFSLINFGTTHEGPGNKLANYARSVADLPSEKRHDPAKAKVPPYFPDTPKMRELTARYDDLVSAMDEQAGRVIAALKEDGLWENTIVLFFSDHGHGLPRSKRWLLDSGLRVPLIARFPEKYQHLAGGHAPGSETDRLVSFIDFAPTVLSLTGIAQPAHMPGRPFLGERIGEPRDVVFGARDRADDMMELSRAVHDGRFIYVRHFLPHLPYIQGGRIFGNQKESFAELRRAREAGELDETAALIWADRKPVEELYDLRTDPHEVHNLAGDPRFRERIARMRQAMEKWILEHRDTGFLPEAEYHRRARAAGLSIYEMARDPALYDLPAIYRVAARASSGADQAALLAMLRDGDSGTRYWGAVGYLASGVAPDETAMGLLTERLRDTSPSVAIAAAETLCRHGKSDAALAVLIEHLGSAEFRTVLEAARAIHQIGDAARPVLARLEEARKSLESANGPRRYRDFNYASFAGWALEAALIQGGAATAEDFSGDGP